MKLITLNTWQGRLSRNLAPFFEKEKADIVCLQELLSSKEWIPTWDLFQSLETIMNASKLDHSYFSTLYSYDVMGKQVRFGNGLISRYPFISKQTIFTNGDYRKIPDKEYTTNTRNAQIVEINTIKGNLTIVNHHAHWEKDPMGSELSVERITKLIKNLKSVEGPLIIAGDFNLWTKSKAIEKLKTELNVIDLTEINKIDNTLSNEVTPYKVACDHVFISKHIKVKNFKLNKSLLSDHKALILEFDL
jgi:endonuclease/exonuclease/phosphatase family metal-dependent hydrolase